MSSGTSKDYVRRVLSGALVVVLFPIIAMSILLLIVAHNGCSRFFAIGCLMACWAVLFVTYRTPGSRWRWFMPAGLLCAAVMTLCLARISAPAGGSLTCAGLTSLHVSESRARPWSPAVLVSEHDQLRMGSFILPWLDPYMDRTQAAAFRADFDAVYDDMNEQFGLFDLGSVMGDVYRDILVSHPSEEHYYIYVPDAEGPRPVFIFLHGWLGNFKAYIWVWRSFADATGTAIVCPSHGAGQWNRRHSEDRIRWALEHCDRDERLDADHITLVGLSNGGMGVTRAALAMPDTFERLIYLSPVIEEDIVAAPPFAQLLADVPILIVSGAEDRRVPESYVVECAQAMIRSGLNVHTLMVPDQDHFLLLSDFDAVATIIQHWQGPEPR